MPETYVVFLLDRTGSMSRLKPTNIHGFNNFVSTLQEQPGSEQIRFTLVQFYGLGADTIYQRAPIREVAPIKDGDFRPKGSTPLVDATYKTIQAVARAIEPAPAASTSTAAGAQADRPNVVVCIQSDGDDNSSVEYDWDELQALIAEKRTQGWQVFFLGAKIDPEEQAEQLGIPAEHVMTYPEDFEAAREIFALAAEKVASRASAPKDHATSSGPQTQAPAPQHEPSPHTTQKIPDDITV